ncbi:aspartate aminotransferase family protein [Parasporobacterium paucivorans]|uniref:Acetylornithine aminotransferase n=1 Tax=Parasporobacterium paucivorans DSM 15970 TaxID=1122934 RepID=A0A1M6G853_9FIRM|nr:aspartate aminotransferase family protein [Parasporobacterium paucivorans]SHJ06185.1 acetylornithine/N-succinyldiaminopimelate aminotransferase [Parasporobacterium paucivorans DSM 15970]
MNTQEYIDLGDEYFISTYNRHKIVLDKGEGVYLYDHSGKKYLDFASGIGVFALGYGNQEYNDALKAQIDNLIHASNYYYTVPAVTAAQKLCKAAEMKRVFFTNSGAEAVEGAIKLARKYAFNKDGIADHEIIAMKHAFHGRTLGALSVTGTPKYQTPFNPMPGGVCFAEYNNLDSVKELVNDKTCAIILECVQGEGGIHLADRDFMEGIKKICMEKDILLICDEIQCGMGRTGKMFAYMHYDLKPDIVTVAKALGCGVPVGAFLAGEKTQDSMKAGDHGSTYGGNPLVTAAVSKVFDLFESYDILNNVNVVGGYLAEKLDETAVKYGSILERRGIGMMQGLEFDRPVDKLVSMALKEGLIIISAGPNTVRFLPPLIITNEDVDSMIFILEKCIESCMV